ncbi:L-amino acid N-acyltransferase YncA [Microbacterium testaceum]|uniref:GNAT family N-acetyltransferase n=1 Tax=Microbacterium testaceum TaxID=2033 RepID=UPI00278941F6|nr:GNAT family N-acetyltransferase [Microbacterium testaceum]MDQ1172361.1 L-amino acid N-acyltransferase YncA [Microbacterium testaceum]
MIEFRDARPEDLDDMVEVQNAIHRAGLRAWAVDADFVRERYLDDGEHTIVLTVAVRDGVVIGFQSLKRAWAGNPYGVEEGWGIIGTHIHPDMGRSGIGRSLFARSVAAAQDAGLRHIDATIGADNAPGLAYYVAMGFVPYREGDGESGIPHRFDL